MGKSFLKIGGRYGCYTYSSMNRLFFHIEYNSDVFQGQQVPTKKNIYFFFF